MKKIATCLKMAISAVRAILKKFKTTGTVTNLPGRGPMFIFPPRTARRMTRWEKNPQGSLLENYRGK